MSDLFPSSSLIKLSNVNRNENTDTKLPVLSSNQTEPTVNQVWGPFYVQYAPFRAKISPIDALGIPLIVKGHVFGLDTRKPLSFVSIDIWHTSPQAKYDYHENDPNVKFEYKEELNTHGLSSHFDYRARLITDEEGQYEFETVKPVPYFDTDDSTWRCPHIHYYVQAHGYEPVITQLYFKGEDKNDIDHHILLSTTIELKPVQCVRTDGSNFLYYQGEFDIIMGPSSS